MKAKKKSSDLKSLTRTELLELLFAQSRKIDELNEKLERAEEALNRRNIEIEKAGSIAEASLRLNKVFLATQKACDQYMENIRIEGEKRRKQCKDMEDATLEKCRKLLMETKRRTGK